ncbi:MAG: thymidine phosphorylase [Myxococcota bacterium]
MAKRSSLSFSAPELIAKKRDGGKLSTEEIAAWIQAYVREDVTEYQMAAMAMAIYFQGMTPEETAALTLAMRDSGKTIDLSSVKGIKVDKHSTGGVGDKVSLCLAPLVAACGVPVPMIAGRGLGHTGGTVDKLEAIPGYRADLSTRQFVRQVGRIGTAIFGQTGELAPADRKLYALRDVTATIESIPLITASILSKKLAEGIDALVMDIKVGKGAFMKDIDQARLLARSIMRVGKLAGKRVSVLLTRMDAPLGNAIGNANETKEALEVLHGGGPADLVECTMALGAEMLRLGGVAKNERAARSDLQNAIDSGAALDVMEKVVQAQKGIASVVRDPSQLRIAKARVPVKAPKTGFVTAIDARELGLASVTLGAGRTRSDQAVDHAVGIHVHRKPGDRVTKGELLAELQVHRRTRSVADRVQNAFTIGRTAPASRPLVLETIRR